MPVEAIIEEYEKQRGVIVSAIKAQDALIERLRTMGDDDYDWISVKEASRITGKSIPTIYRWHNEGKFKKFRHFGRELNLSRNEIMEIDDKYGR